MIPHDHRYAFVTTVLAGAVANKVFWGLKGEPAASKREAFEAQTRLFDHFEYRTPLNGGDGFSWVGERRLWSSPGTGERRGAHWHCRADEIHTLDIRCEGTVILLEQLADEVPLDQPTNAYRLAGDKTPPSLDGLYDRMTPDHARVRIEQFLDLIGNRT